ncbi:hypothetical protein MIND_01282200 [Mycena indigotica]|uniref:C2H2-type domain-containing protein n=1 Tax=Mycena indigotica TaxID=2126181 RepID=A0A8H6VRI4_9AGAR|nr:uncharacterized protein MIND_01282200 [Mycena indigotica]KAF7291377.1 hypothetical protein MIND_01282200 [Mycena indigotica]
MSESPPASQVYQVALIPCMAFLAGVNALFFVVGKGLLAGGFASDVGDPKMFSGAAAFVLVPAYSICLIACGVVVGYKATVHVAMESENMVGLRDKCMLVVAEPDAGALTLAGFGNEKGELGHTPVNPRQSVEPSVPGLQGEDAAARDTSAPDSKVNGEPETAMDDDSTTATMVFACIDCPFSFPKLTMLHEHLEVAHYRFPMDAPSGCAAEMREDREKHWRKIRTGHMESYYGAGGPPVPSSSAQAAPGVAEFFARMDEWCSQDYYGDPPYNLGGFYCPSNSDSDELALRMGYSIGSGLK